MRDEGVFDDGGVGVDKGECDSYGVIDEFYDFAGF